VTSIICRPALKYWYLVQSQKGFELHHGAHLPFLNGLLVAANIEEGIFIFCFGEQTANGKYYVQLRQKATVRGIIVVWVRVVDFV
jgi:hypothetical protein